MCVSIIFVTLSGGLFGVGFLFLIAPFTYTYAIFSFDTWGMFWRPVLGVVNDNENFSVTDSKLDCSLRIMYMFVRWT